MPAFTIGGGGKNKATAPGAIPGTLPGSAAGGGGAYGGVPTVPNPITTAGQAVTGDISNLGQIYDLSKSVNAFDQAELLKQFQSAIPNYTQMVSQQSNNIGQELSGQVPEDVINQLLQQGAERGIMTGSPGGPNANAAYMRALGLTSLGLQQSGTDNLKTAIGEAPIAQPFDPSKFFVSPEQQQQAQLAANIYRSAPDPAAAAAAARAAGTVQMPSMFSPFGGGGGGGNGFSTGTSPWYDPGTLAPWSAGGGETSTATTDPYADWNQWADSISPDPSAAASYSDASMLDPYGGGSGDWLGDMQDMMF